MTKSPTREQFQSIKSLDPTVLEELDRRLTDGEGCSKVGHWLQQELKLFVAVKPMALKKMLERYRGKEIRDKMLKRIAGLQKNVSATAVVQRVNALTAMENLVEKQLKRVDKMLEMEKDKPLLIKMTSDEIQLAKELLSDLGRLQLETGFLQRISKSYTGTLTDQNGETKTFTWTEETEKLYQELTGETPDQEAA